MLDLVLAVLHHLLILSLAGLLAVELALIKPGVGGAALKTLGLIDVGYGVTATLILAVGFGRVFLGVKGAAFYLHNPMFWAKIAAFAVVGLLSISPTLAIFALIPIFAAAMARGYGL
jgi:putative membrane protein